MDKKSFFNNVTVSFAGGFLPGMAIAYAKTSVCCRWRSSKALGFLSEL